MSKAKTLIIFTLAMFIVGCEDYNTPTNTDPIVYMYYGLGTGVINKYGGEVYIKDETSPIYNAVFAIPENSISESTQLTLSDATDAIHINEYPDAVVIRVVPEDLDMAEHAVVGMSYADMNISNMDMLQLFRYIPSTGQLLALSGQNRDTERKIQYGKTNSTGYFTILEVDPPTVVTGSMTDSRDLQEYKWVEIEGQKWMAENLNFASPTGSWCYFGSDINCQDYGRLYQWSTATTVCPPGWHLPSHDEWKQLESVLGLSDPDPIMDIWKEDGEVGKKLKSITGWANEGNGNDFVQFNALPAGFRDGDGQYYYLGTAARFWTSTPYGADYIARYIHDDTDGIFWGVRGGNRAMSVRCVEGGDDTAPTVNTITVNNITGLTADIVAEVRSEGSSPVTERGVCWNTEGYPQITDNVLIEGSGNGEYTLRISGLERGQTYYVRAFAKNINNLGYGEELSFTTDAAGNETGEITDPRDQKKYTTVKIGQDWWMAQNLDYDSGDGSWCYDGSADKCSEFGKLYDWITALSACPEGWRLPSDEDWQHLEITLGMEISDAELESWRVSGEVGKHIKSEEGWYNDGNGTNESGLNILPGGFRDGYGSFSNVGNEARYWSSSQSDDENAWYRQLNYLNIGVYRHKRSKDLGFSVRCIQGEEEGVPELSTAGVSEVTGFTVNAGGEVIAEGSSNVVERGICWNTSGYPDYNDEKIAVGSGLGTFNTTLYGLERETTYYLRSYAWNDDKVGYGQIVTFTTASHAAERSTLQDPRDQQEYNIVKIGENWWFAENLAYDIGVAGFCYDDLPSNCSTYGRLYTWEGAKIACPAGWHLATDTDWKNLETVLGMDIDQLDLMQWRETGSVGRRIKSDQNWYQSGNGSNDTGFNAQPAGFRDVDGSYDQLFQQARFWTGTNSGNDEGYVRFLEYEDDGIYRHARGQERGLSVRCVKDN